ncbi:MAG: asparagine synthase (glutamine-hydrolyzing) [Candidatus Sericytochromatia bacterium]
MCGIVGSFGEADPGVLAAMNARIHHRGPDDGGAWIEGPVALAMRRLAILDLEGGKQPMATAAGDRVVVFNGEIYNFKDLAAAHLTGVPLRTHSDTEVVLALYDRLGEAAFALLNGMFAIALWDGRKRQLLLVRDRLGIKPLYYHDGPTRLTFASEIKALLADPAVARRLDPASLASYMTWQYVPGPETMLAGVKKLPPGSLMRLAEGRPPEIATYWRPEAPEVLSSRATDFDAVLAAAVERQMISDVPLGAFLSGGVDSSLVVAMMAERAGGALETFTAGFADPRLDESPWAAKVARHLGVRHSVVRLDAGALEQLPALVHALDEPVADRAALPTYMLARFARERVKVVLTGEGADELFAGYPRYRLEALARTFHRLPFAERRGLWRAVVAAAPQALRPRLAKVLLSPADPDARREAWLANFDGETRRALIGPHSPHPMPRLEGPGLAAQLRLDMQTWLVDNVLMKVDKTTMAASLEARVPFLDHDVVDWALALPASEKLQGGVSKAVVKRAAAGRLPDEVVHRPKQAFHTPTALWFREPAGKALLTDVLLGDRARGRGLVDPSRVEGLIRAHLDGHDRDQALWNLLVLELWLSRYLDAPVSAPV